MIPMGAGLGKELGSGLLGQPAVVIVTWGGVAPSHSRTIAHWVRHPGHIWIWGRRIYRQLEPLASSPSRV